jgi:Uma2 family endonuclease
MDLPHYKIDYISEETYLEDEKMRDIKHEYFDGEIFAMTGASISHQRIISNLVINMGTHLKHTACEVFSSDIKVRADSGKKYFYPDALVVCQNDDKDAYYTESPRIIVEVLSNSTRKFDKNLKRHIYQAIPTLEEYVLIEQDRVEIEISRRSTNWQPVFYFIDDDITFESIDLTLPVLELYQRVENDEIHAFMKTLELAKLEEVNSKDNIAF